MNFKRKVSGSWVDAPHYIMGTSTDTITPPTTIYADGTSASLTIKGNTVQNGTPSPSNPVDVVGCGELETTGEHAGQYKIPILNGSTTTNVYLGEAQTVRQIKKLVLTGGESWAAHATYSGLFTLTVNDYLFENEIICKSSHYRSIKNTAAGYVLNNNISFYCHTGDPRRILYIHDDNYSTAADFKTYLQQQYANGTPVTIWYVLATEETAVVNEPLQKLGSYADSLTTSIPTTDGANSLSVDTTVQPSEVSATYHGWHSVQSVHEYDSGAWT